MPRSLGCFDEFAMASYRPLVSFAVTLTGSRPFAEDVVQEALFNVWRKWGSGHVDAPLAYAKRAVLRVFLSQARKRASSEVSVAEGVDRAVAAESDRALDADLLLRALMQLPQQMRAVVVLRFREDLSEATVADLLDISVGSVKSQASRGRARLQELLASSASSSDMTGREN